MDRVTRRPLFGSPYPARVSGLASDEDSSYTYELVGVGPEGGPWEQNQWEAGPGANKNELDTGGSGTTYRRWASREGQWVPQTLWTDVDKEKMTAHIWDASIDGTRRHLDGELWAANPQSPGTRRSSMSSGYCTLNSGAPRKPLPEDNAVDTEQINFQAAREQFLSLERANSGIPPAPQSKGSVARPSQTAKAWNRTPEAKDKVVDKVVAPAKPPRKMSTTTEERRVRAPWNDEEVAPWAREATPTVQKRPEAPEATPTVQKRPEAPETPIEREIRLAQEREADLREQRGLQRSTSHQELVQIPVRPPLLARPDLSPDARPERRGASLYVKWDMAQETQREAEHRLEHHELQLGRSPVPDSSPQSPLPALRRAWSSDSLLEEPPTCRTPEYGAGPRKVNRIPPDAYQPFLNPSPPRSAGVPASSAACSAGPAQAAKAQAPSPRGPVLESSRKSWGTSEKGSRQGSQARGRTDGPVLKKEYFLLRPLRFGVPDVPRREEAPQVRTPQDGPPAWRLHRSQSSELLEKEVESVLRRERELAEERLNVLYPEVFSPTPDFVDSDPDSRSSSRASGTTGSYSVSEPHTFTPIHLHSGLVWTAPAPADDEFTQKRKEQWYAGLNPSDHINSEVLESTRVPRHKSLMAQRWEAGIYISEDED